MKLELFKRVQDSLGSQTFTHYWSNEGQNYFDSVIQTLDENNRHIETESGDPVNNYLQQFIDGGYYWQEIPTGRYQRSDISTIHVQLSEEDFKSSPVLFFKLTETDEEGNEVGKPFYYYSDNVTEVSDQNYQGITSYTVVCKLDLWPTAWIHMHSAMKDCPEMVEFMNKHCDRFIFNYVPGIATRGFWIDYLEQPYLMRTNKYESNLLVTDKRENYLTLEDWLFINSGEFYKKDKTSWIKEVWLPWLNNQWCSVFDPAGVKGIISSSTKADFKLIDYYKYSLDESRNILNCFLDTFYNSNSKYRYLICKTGNNTWPLKQNPTQGQALGEKKQVMFNTQLLICKNAEPKENQKVVISLDNPIITTKPTFVRDGNVYTASIELGSSQTLQTEDVEILFSFENWIIGEKSLWFNFSFNGKSKTYLWRDNLEEKLSYVYVEKFKHNTEYEILKLPVKSDIFDIKNDFLNAGLTLYLKVDNNNKIYLVFKIDVESNFIDYSNLTISFDSSINFTIKDLFIIFDCQATTNSTEFFLDGESLLIIPFKKGEDEKKYLRALNNPDISGISMGEGSVLGMAINDIPPSILALASRTLNNSNKIQTQTLNDILSSRTINNGQHCPLNIIDMYTKIQNADQEHNILEEKIDIPVMFHSFDYIPVCVATSPNASDIYNCVGGNNFFNYLYDILTNSYLTKNTYDEFGTLIHGGNTIESDPFFYSPAFWKWTYFIDGNHKLELTADMIDLKKLVTEKQWQVFLNVNITDATHYLLDIRDIKNKKYPMSKVGMELIAGDQSNFPFTTEYYNAWLENHKWTKESSQNARDIANKYAMKNATINAITAPIGGAISGAGEGGAKFGAKGAAVGGAAGAIGGLIKGLGGLLGAQLAIDEANEKWNNEWREELGNLYSSPTILHSSGYANGSLIYSPSIKAISNSYELFRTYVIPQLMKDYIWHDISMNGYPFLSQCLYADYNNRVNFNVIKANLFDKQYVVINWLKERMFQINPLFAQQEFINSFIDKCQKLFRVFKVNYDEQNIENIVSGNIELKREWVEPFHASSNYKEILVNDVSNVEDQTKWTEYNEWNDRYIADSTNKNEVLAKQDYVTHKEIELKYSDLDVEDINEFRDLYYGLSLSNRTSSISLSGGINYNKTNDSNYTDIEIKFPEDWSGSEIKKNYVNQNDNNSVGSFIFISENELPKYYSKTYSNGWGVSIKENDDNDGIIITLDSYSKFIFDNSVDATDKNLNSYFGVNELTIPHWNISLSQWDSTSLEGRNFVGYLKTPLSWVSHSNISYNISNAYDWTLSDELSKFDRNVAYVGRLITETYNYKPEADIYNNHKFLNSEVVQGFENIPFTSICGDNKAEIEIFEKVKFRWWPFKDSKFSSDTWQQKNDKSYNELYAEQGYTPLDAWRPALMKATLNIQDLKNVYKNIKENVPYRDWWNVEKSRIRSFNNELSTGEILDGYLYYDMWITVNYNNYPNDYTKWTFTLWRGIYLAARSDKAPNDGGVRWFEISERSPDAYAKIKFTEKLKESYFKMNNKVKSLVFFKRDNIEPEERIILSNKKEGN